MNNVFEPFTAAGKSSIETFEAVAGPALSGVEQMAQLNMAVSKAVLAESFDHAQSLLSLRDPQQMLVLFGEMVQPMAERMASYGRQAYEIMQSTGAEIAKVTEAKMNEAQQAFVAAVDDAVKNAPVGSEAAMAMFRNAFSASQDAIATAQNAARQAVAKTEANMESATDQAVATVKNVSRKR